MIFFFESCVFLGSGAEEEGPVSAVEVLEAGLPAPLRYVSDEEIQERRWRLNRCKFAIQSYKSQL